MAQMTVLDSTGATVIIEKPLAPGTAAAASSGPVTLSTEDKALLTGLDTKLTTSITHLSQIEAATEDVATKRPVKTADGDQVTLGAIADLAWSGSGTATAIAALKAACLSLTTTVSHLNAIKVAAEDATAAQVVIADGDLATMGLKNDAAWDEVAAAPSLMALLKRMVLSKERKGIQYYAQTAVTRPADTTLYTGGDVVGAAAAAITFTSFGAASQTTEIFGASIRVDLSTVPAWAASLRLHLYSVTPPSALADNAPWTLPSGDRASYLGYIDIGTPVLATSTSWVQDMSIRFPARMAGTSLFGYLVTPGGGASAASTAISITLYGVAL